MLSEQTSEDIGSTRNDEKGFLDLTLLRGDLFLNTELFGKMDPYIVIERKNVKYKSKVHKNGG
jgi:hypothetical protein